MINVIVYIVLKYLIKKVIWKKKTYNRLRNGYVDDKDFGHAKNVWNEFKMKTMGYYHDLYLKGNILF